MGIATNVITRGGAWYTLQFNGNIIKEMGKDKLIIAVRENNDAYEYLKGILSVNGATVTPEDVDVEVAGENDYAES